MVQSVQHRPAYEPLTGDAGTRRRSFGSGTHREGMVGRRAAWSSNINSVHAVVTPPTRTPQSLFKGIQEVEVRGAPAVSIVVLPSPRSSKRAGASNTATALPAPSYICEQGRRCKEEELLPLLPSSYERSRASPQPDRQSCRAGIG
eukprot:scaffold518_cov388-Prasinococcus_capsulatus_cf.AAC.49